MGLGYYLTMEPCASLGMRTTRTKDSMSLTKSKKKDENTARKMESNSMKKKTHPGDACKQPLLVPVCMAYRERF